MTCRICQSYTSEVVNETYGRPVGLCLACGAGYLDGYAAGYEAAVRDFWRDVCEQKAKEAEPFVIARQQRAARYYREMHRDFCQWHDPSLARVFARSQEACARAYADARELAAQVAQLRAWAGEA